MTGSSLEDDTDDPCSTREQSAREADTESEFPEPTDDTESDIDSDSDSDDEVRITLMKATVLFILL